MNVRALVLTGFGINCDGETTLAFNRAGASAECIHLNDVISDPDSLDRYHILAIPGGFSFGDDVASGRILANRLRYKLGQSLKRFVTDGKLVIGICNGFQVMVKMGLLPLIDSEFVQEVTLTQNDSGRFENRWIHLKKEPRTPCVWLKGLDRLELVVRHGEGKFIARDKRLLAQLGQNGQIVVRYCTPGGVPAQGDFPANPNGSQDDIAGICDPSGRVFGLMPHPEAYLDRTHHPRWLREDLPKKGPGLQVFRNAVTYAQDNLP